MNFPDNPSGGDLFNGFIYNATLGVWDVATSDGYFAVTNSASSAYVFNGFGTDSDSNPTLYLHRGKTYEFAVNATGHPFYIKTVSGTGTGNAYSDGVTNNGTASGTIKFVVPQDAPSKLYYNCSAHAAMAGEIIIPRAAQIDDLSDVDTSTTAPTDGQVLTWDNANSKWEPATASGGIALTDLSVTTNSAGTAALTYTNSTGVFTYTPPDLSGYLTSISGQSIEDLSDVNTMTPTDGQVLTWDNANSRWDAVSPSGGSYNDASVDTHLNTSTAATNEVLSWNGTDYDWVAQSGGGGASVTTADTAPSSPSDGDLWYDTTTLRLYVYYNDGSSSQWVKANPSGSRDSNTSVAIQETAPSNPSSGDMWFDPNALKTYIYYNDGDSNQWVQANPTGGGGSGGSVVTTYADLAARNSASPSAGDLGFVASNKALYLYDGSEWDRISAGADESPVILTEPPTTTQQLQADGSTSTVTMTAQDPEGFGITYGIAYKTANNARPAQLSSDTTIDQATGVFTFTPTTNTSNNGSFTARLSASDGVKTTTRLVDFDLQFTHTLYYVVVGGGGGGGGSQGSYAAGGGGGAGGYRSSWNNESSGGGASAESAITGSPNDTYTITVGAGGTGAVSSGAGTNGGDSSIAKTGMTTITAIGGGYGSSASGTNAASGGSGGGGNPYNASGAAGTANQGYAGGDGYGSGADYSGGGGGGAGGVGETASAGTYGGNGGVGVASTITGTSIFRAGGGGGGDHDGAIGGAGGNGGGGDGNQTAGGNGLNGTANTGGGGGGGGINSSSAVNGGDGGSGVVIIRTSVQARSTTGSPVVTTSGSDYIYQFNNDGTISF